MFKAGDILRHKNQWKQSRFQLLELVAPKEWRFKFLDPDEVATYTYPFDPQYWEVVKPAKKKRYL